MLIMKLLKCCLITFLIKNDPQINVGQCEVKRNVPQAAAHNNVKITESYFDRKGKNKCHTI